jgi:hypothetical protein
VASKFKERREQLEIMHQELRSHGIEHWTERPINTGHVLISFLDKDGNVRSLTIGGSSDRKARLRNRSILRQMLEGRR